MTAGGTRVRADAQRNRARIVAATTAAFESAGVLAPTDAIAEAAGLGNATLYRHFPNREDLLAAVIADRVADAVATARERERTTEPGEALREWAHQLAWELRRWHDLPASVALALQSPASPVADVCRTLVEHTDDLLVRADGTGALRQRVDAQRLFEIITAASWAAERFRDDAEAARERTSLMLAGVLA